MTLIEQVTSKVMEMANTQRKQEVATQVVNDIRYAVDHMDETEYGIDFIHNLAVATGVVDGEYNKIEDGIVRNTQRELIGRIQSLTNGRRQKDPDCTQKKDTLLPGSDWVYRGLWSFVRRCKHNFTVHFKCGKHGSVPHFEEVAKRMQELINNA